MIIFVILFGWDSAAAEDVLESQSKILLIIAQTANRICYTVEQGGRESDVGLSVEAGAQLKGGITKLEDLDAKGAEQFRGEKYQGVLRHELATILKQTQDCKQDVFDKLLNRLMPIRVLTSPTPFMNETKQDGAGTDDGFNTVRRFYVALANADGIKASSLVIPEKREAGPFSAKEITKFYSSLVEPLQLVELAPVGGNKYQATYTYRASSSHGCAGSAIVTIVERNGRPYIEKIKALQGC